MKFRLFTLLTLLSSALFADNGIIGWWVVDKDYLEQVVKDMEKTAAQQDLKMLKMFMPMVESRMSKMTMIFEEKKFTQIFGDRQKSTEYTLVSQDGESFTLQMGQRKMTLKLIDGRLVNAAELKSKRPAMYLRKLTAEEVALRKEEIRKASLPPESSAPADDRLRFLIYKATAEQVDKLLAEQSDLVSISFSHDKFTAIATAVRDGKLELIKKLIAAGAKLDFVDERKKNLLFIAAEGFKPQKEVFEVLVNKGLDPKIMDKDKETLLISYCRRGKDLKAIDYLLSLGIDINAQSSWDRSALSQAMNNDWSEGVAYLLEKGADSKALAETIDKIARKGDLKKLEFLALHKVFQDDQGNTALMEALSYSRLKNKEKIIPEMIQLLKETVNLQNVSKETALMHTQELPFIKLLIENGADPKLKDQSDETVLHYAAAADLEVLKYYIEELKLDINSAGDRSQTPLHMAVYEKNNLANVKYLLSKGADANAGAKENKSSPLEYAVSGEYENKIELYDLLLEHGADIKNESMMHDVIKNAIFKNDQRSIDYFHKKGVNMQVNPKEYYSIFWYTISANKIGLLKYFLKLGIDPKVKNAAGKDALALAKEMNKPEAIEILSK